MEYVYLMRAGYVYKIGRSTNPARRRIELAGEARLLSPEELILMHVIETNDAEALERRLLQGFRKFRRRGEWFDLPWAAADWICQQTGMIGAVPSFVADDRADEDTTFLTIPEAAQYIGITEKALRQWIHRGDVQSVRLSWRTTRVRLTDVQRIKRLRDG